MGSQAGSMSFSDQNQVIERTHLSNQVQLCWCEWEETFEEVRALEDAAASRMMWAYS